MLVVQARVALIVNYDCYTVSFKTMLRLFSILTPLCYPERLNWRLFEKLSGRIHFNEVTLFLMESRMRHRLQRAGVRERDRDVTAVSHGGTGYITSDFTDGIMVASQMASLSRLRCSRFRNS
jgi:hypothetical protein